MTPPSWRLREKQKRNLLSTLILSQGVPMICAGDEMGRTQGGNNNAYCQDNEISWVNWDLDAAQKALLEFTCRVSGLQRRHAVFQRRQFLSRQTDPVENPKTFSGWTRSGQEMTEENWNAGLPKFWAFSWRGTRFTISMKQGTPRSRSNLPSYS
jgi:isoamylase